MPNNGNRAMTAELALIKQSGANEVKHDPTSAVVDMLTNLMHFCQKHELDFNDALRIANNHFITENGVHLTQPKDEIVHVVIRTVEGKHLDIKSTHRNVTIHFVDTETTTDLCEAKIVGGAYDNNVCWLGYEEMKGDLKFTDIEAIVQADDKRPDAR